MTSWSLCRHFSAEEREESSEGGLGIEEEKLKVGLCA